MADVSKIKLDNTTYDVKDSIARNNMIYSNNEIAVGTWIDNKTIYRKVLTHPATSYIASNTQITIPHQINNLNEVIKCDAIAIWNGEKFMPMPSHYQNVTNIISVNYIDSTNLYFTSFNDNWGATKVYFIIEYTKTN